MNDPFETAGHTALLPIVKVTVVLLICAAIAIALRQQSACVRHLVWTCGLSISLLLPLASCIMPTIDISRPAQLAEQHLDSSISGFAAHSRVGMIGSNHNAAEHIPNPLAVDPVELETDIAVLPR